MSWGCSCSLFCSAPNTAGRNPNTLVLVGSLHAKHCRLHVASRLVATIALPLYTDRGCRKLHMSARRVMLAGSPATSHLAPGEGIVMRSGSPAALNETGRCPGMPTSTESYVLRTYLAAPNNSCFGFC